ncbi:MAG: hypothetical protein ACRBN8_45555 [Nannocystales bacterium]
MILRAIVILVLLAVGGDSESALVPTTAAEKGRGTRVTLEGRVFDAGGRAADILIAEDPLNELIGGPGFDLLLAPNGAARTSLHKDGGIALAGGSGGTEFHLNSGLSVAIGSPGPDTVHVWGGFNLIVLGPGDDEVIEHGGAGVSVVFGGSGTDTYSCLGGCWTTWVWGAHRGQRAAQSDSARKLVVLAVPRTHHAVLESGGVLVENPAPGSSGTPLQQYTLEVWGVLEGSDPGPELRAHIPGGTFRWPNGTSARLSSAWGRGPNLDEARVFHLERRASSEGWLFERAETGTMVGDAVQRR